MSNITTSAIAHDHIKTSRDHELDVYKTSKKCLLVSYRPLRKVCSQQPLGLKRCQTLGRTLLVRHRRAAATTSPRESAPAASTKHLDKHLKKR